MKNGDKKGLKSFYRTTQTGDPILCYDLGYGYIPAQEYHYYRDNLKYSDEDIKDKSILYKDLIMESELEAEKGRMETQITNLRDLMVYIYKNLLSNEERGDVKEKLKENMTSEEKIKCFPEKYRNVLRLRLAYDERNETKSETTNETKIVEYTKNIEDNIAENKLVDDIILEGVDNIINPFL